MIKIYSFIIGMGLMLSLSAQEYTYSDSWGDPGITVTSQTTDNVNLNFSMDRHSFHAVTINGESMQEIGLPEVFLPGNTGAPNLPGMGRFIALPQGASVSCEMVSFRTETFYNVDIAPAPRIPWDTETTPLEYNKDESIYLADKFYPEQPVSLSKISAIRGVDAAMLGITPFQYNPVTRELIVYRDIEVAISFEGGNGQFGEERLRSRWFDPILRDVFLNQASIPVMDYNKSFQGTKDLGCEYLIVTPNNEDFQAWADSIKQFRTLQGIMTDVVTLDDIGGNNVNTLEGYFNDAYNTWDIVPAAVLLLGDYSTNASEGIVSPIWDNYCVSDNIYADVTNNDMPDIIFARMTAQDESQLEVMVTKFLNYERTPPTSEGFYDHPITALGWQTERWFQICSETIGGFWKNELGKDPVRVNEVYDGNPDVDPWSTATNTNVVLYYFGPNGLGYIPASPSELGNWSDGDADDINEALNNGSFMLQHRDHGFELGWGEPDYSNGDINGLTNTDLSFILSINCLTGKYNIANECFAEKFHRYTFNGENSGALGLIAASEVSYSFVNDAYVWGLYDHIWPDFLPSFGSSVEHNGIYPAFGNAAGKYFLMQSSWPYNTGNKEVTYNLFHHHGDAFLNVYSEVPQEMVVLHNEKLLEGATSFSLFAYEGAFVSLTVEGEIIATTTAIEGQTTLEIPPQTQGSELLVTVTLQNYYRHESHVEVIDGDVAYVVHESSQLNDASGNGNGQLDYGESLGLSVTMENIGTLLASSVEVNLTTENEYITITDGNEIFGDFTPGASVFVEDAFAFDVDYLIGDNEYVFFTLEATDGTETWNSQLAFKAHAPVLEYVEYSISDPTGNNNGRIDPGETVQITVSVTNTGSSEAFDIMGELFCSNPDITINSNAQNFGNLVQGALADQTFEVMADGSMEDGVQITFDLNLEASGGVPGSGSFSTVIGQYIALILDLDPMNYSGPGIYETFNDMEVFVEYMNSFPDDPGLYKNIFVCLGLHFTNYELSDEEGQILKDYLLNGGNLYMEGRLTWKDDPQTPVHSMFNVEALPTGMYLIDEVHGLEGSMTWNMLFGYEGNNPVCDYSLEPVAPAYRLFSTQDDDHTGMVAYNPGTYRTIASTLEFGKFMDGESPSTKTALMAKFLNWFDGTITGLDENGTGLYTRSSLSSHPNPFVDGTTLSIILANDADIEVSVVNIQGQVVKKIYSGKASAGSHEYTWDGTNTVHESAGAGIYFGILKTDKGVVTEKIIRMDR